MYVRYSHLTYTLTGFDLTAHYIHST
jgi:hypothetical protein